MKLPSAFYHNIINLIHMYHSPQKLSMKNNSLYPALNTFSFCILTMLCSSCLFLGELKPKKFSNVFAGGCYLETFDALYLLVGIIKVRERELNHFFVPPQFCVSYTKEILFMIKVKDNGNTEVQSHLLNSPMSGFYVASGIKLIKAENDILIFDKQESYLLKDDKLIPFDASSNTKLALVINEYQAKGNWKILEEWNRQNKCRHDEISNLYFAPYEQNINWKDHVITIRRNRHNYDEKDRVIISISCKDLLNSPILLVIPIENRESYSTPDFIELPYIIINDNLHPFSADNPLIFHSKCCCKNNQEGTVKLVQLINKDGKKFLVDINNDDLHDKRRRGFIEDNRVVGYIEEGGRSYPRYPGGYIDAPGLMKDEKKNKLKKSWLSYSAHILIEAYCKCDSRDEYLGQSVLLYVQRKKFHKNLDIFIIRNGEAPSQYPKYVEEIRKDYFFDR